MIEGGVCLDGEESDRIRLSMTRCPAQPERIWTMTAHASPKQPVQLSSGTNVGAIWGMSVHVRKGPS
jgi:hypothetical protein